MSKLVLSGDTSGSVTLDAPAVSGTTTLTLPTTSGTVITTATGQTLTSPVIAGTPTGVGVLTADTAKASTSGTSIDFTSIPSWVKRITVMFSGVSTSGTANPLIQIGTGGTPTTSGYVSSSSQLSSAAFVISSTAGYIIYSNSAGFVFSGALTITNVSGNIWVASGTLANTAVSAATFTTAGTLTLGGTLNMVRITTSNGTDTFDAGSINILYE